MKEKRKGNKWSGTGQKNPNHKSPAHCLILMFAFVARFFAIHTGVLSIYFKEERLKQKAKQKQKFRLVVVVKVEISSR